ncbi:hypothetical protein SDC9_79882 [bioreactor metagenome]|uniref:Uncharacterized protein n=1 Tax=bioreactor metagenome TaxID=1076179 RepID=A0A644YYC8_9ZZZZ
MFDFDDGSAPVVSRTETGIDLTSTEMGLSTVKDFANLSPFATNDGKNEERTRKFILIGGVAVGAIILGLVIWFVVKLFTSLSV